MQSSNNNNKQEPLSNLAYDWVTIIQHKSEALRAYQEYIRDAQQANSPECAQLMQKIFEDDTRHVQEATQHLMQVLQGQMGRGQSGQGSMGQSGQGSMGQSSGGSMGGQSGSMGQGSQSGGGMQGGNGR